MKTLRCCLFFAAALLLGVYNVRADDGAASVAVGGIQLRREANVLMEKEVLRISETKVTVDYDFVNQSDRNVTTVVEFPIPAYDVGFDEPRGPRNFDDFRLWVDGDPITYQSEIHAMLHGKDYTALLKSLGVDIASFGGWDVKNGKEIGPITKLPPEKLRQLVALGLIPSDGASLIPQWLDTKTIYWTQFFPAHKTIHIRHEYTPAVGFESIPPDIFGPVAIDRYITDYSRKNIKDSCVDPALQRELVRRATEKYKPSQDVIQVAWVDFILTTANTWKTPIKGFTLVVDREPPRWFVSFCWDGPISKVGSHTFVAHKTDFVPSRELHIAFFSDPLSH